MFTTKYRFYEPSETPDDCTTRGFTPVEKIDGPYSNLSASFEGGYQVVRCDNASDTPGMTFGPISSTGDFPRPTLWVMNAQGATVATYHL